MGVDAEEESGGGVLEGSVGWSMHRPPAEDHLTLDADWGGRSYERDVIVGQ